MDRQGLDSTPKQAPNTNGYISKHGSNKPSALSCSMSLPSLLSPCSKQYNSQHELPICTPACPICSDTHSLMTSPCFYITIRNISLCLAIDNNLTRQGDSFYSKVRKLQFLLILEIVEDTAYQRKDQATANIQYSADIDLHFLDLYK